MCQQYNNFRMCKSIEPKASYDYCCVVLDQLYFLSNFVLDQLFLTAYLYACRLLLQACLFNGPLLRKKKGKNYICVRHISNIHSWSKHNQNWRFNWTNKNGNQAAHCVAVMSHIKEASQPTGYGANPSSLLEPCSKTDLVPLLLNITKQVLVPPFTPTKLQMAITHQENKVTQPNMLS